MRVPWIRVHGALFDKPVVTRLVAATHISEHEAVGVLVTFWSGVAAHATNGSIASYPDAQLEKWARWPKRKKGAFARWVRAEHQDPEGRVPEWDDYAGALEVRRERERQRLADKRKKLRNSTHDVAQHDANVGATLQPARANGTERDETIQTTNPEGTRKRASAPEWFDEAMALWSAEVGHVTPAKLIRSLSPLATKYTWPTVKTALQVYVSRDEGPAAAGRDRRLDWFAADFHRWRTIAETPLDDGNGALTDRGRRILTGKAS